MKIYFVWQKAILRTVDAYKLQQSRWEKRCKDVEIQVDVMFVMILYAAAVILE